MIKRFALPCLSLLILAACVTATPAPGPTATAGEAPTVTPLPTLEPTIAAAPTVTPAPPTAVPTDPPAGATIDTATLTILQIVAGDVRFTSLTMALAETGLDATLNAPGSFTLFAPTNDAFATLPEGMLDALLSDPSAYANLLLYHIVGSAEPTSQFATLTELPTLLGPSLQAGGADGFSVNEVPITQADIRASNGVLHVVDTVLFPPEAADE
ncbi:MAG: fasciclin domain-containing protein [Anaerolineae bacterium]|nr:fasciclin domain-containing protein [Anaerolineae bacterium]